MSELPMTATEVREAEQAWTEESAKRQGDIFAKAFEPMIDEMLRIAQQQFGIDPSKAAFIDSTGKLTVVDITNDAD